MRIIPLFTEKIYHIFNRSIAKYIIFNDDIEFSRFLNAVCYYQREKPGIEFSRFINNLKKGENFSVKHKTLSNKKKLVEILSYCLMPTHFHLVVKQLMDGGVSTFLHNVQSSYSRYFNLKHKRRGPLWEGRFKNVSVDTDEQLLHLTRYVHLNPVKAKLVKKAENWKMSSYKEYLLKVKPENKICNFANDLTIDLDNYKDFMENYASYQRDLETRKELFLIDR